MVAAIEERQRDADARTSAAGAGCRRASGCRAVADADRRIGNPAVVRERRVLAERLGLELAARRAPGGARSPASASGSAAGSGAPASSAAASSPSAAHGAYSDRAARRDRDRDARPRRARAGARAPRCRARCARTRAADRSCCRARIFSMSRSLLRGVEVRGDDVALARATYGELAERGRRVAEPLAERADRGLAGLADAQVGGVAARRRACRARSARSTPDREVRGLPSDSGGVRARASRSLRWSARSRSRSARTSSCGFGSTRAWRAAALRGLDPRALRFDHRIAIAQPRRELRRIARAARAPAVQVRRGRRQTKLTIDTIEDNTRFIRLATSTALPGLLLSRIAMKKR